MQALTAISGRTIESTMAAVSSSHSALLPCSRRHSAGSAYDRSALYASGGGGGAGTSAAPYARPL